MKTRRKVLAHGAVADRHAAAERFSGLGRVVSCLPPLFALVYYATRHRE